MSSTSIEDGGAAVSEDLAAMHNEWLSRDRLELKFIINIARGARLEDWEPAYGGEWHRRFEDLKAVIDAEELAATLRGDFANKSAVIKLSDLWQFFCDNRGSPSWQWLDGFCRRWSKVTGESLPKAFGSGRSRKKSDDDIQREKYRRIEAEAKRRGAVFPLQDGDARKFGLALEKVMPPIGLGHDAIRRVLTGDYPPANKLASRGIVKPFWNGQLSPRK
jgi:hypothetical protein